MAGKRMVTRPAAAAAAVLMVLWLAPSAPAATTSDVFDFEDRVGFVNAGLGERAEGCFPDDADDVVAVENNEHVVDEPRADILEHCVNFRVNSLELSVQLEAGEDPAGENNWMGSLLGWFIDTDGDERGEFFAQLSQNRAGEVEATVQDRSDSPASHACDADWNFSEGRYTVTIAHGCIGDPDDVGVGVILVYDQAATQPSGVAVVDIAPETTLTSGLESGFPEGVVRLAGTDRVATAIDAAQAVYAEGEAGAIVLARQDLFPDAQSGTPLAIQEDAPILLTRTAFLDERVAAEMLRLMPPAPGNIVYILGGFQALSQQVEDDVRALGYEVFRYAGTNRFETATIIAEFGLNAPPTVLLADGGDFEDSLLAGAASYAAAHEDPFLPQPDARALVAAVLLTDQATMPPATQQYLTNNPPAALYSIGQDAAVAGQNETAEVFGQDIFGTALAVSDAFFRGQPPIVGIATVTDFADALTGGAIIGDPDVGPGPMLYTFPDDLPDSVAEYLAARADVIRTAIIFGGQRAVDDNVAAEVAAAIA
ncbi:MAG: cell wall-binding repeat-containing protein [Actinobacteria bacterium]|nr:cell wall-binding repeat-containing protein [Actinomycetota bacterium]